MLPALSGVCSRKVASTTGKQLLLASSLFLANADLMLANNNAMLTALTFTLNQQQRPMTGSNSPELTSSSRHITTSSRLYYSSTGQSKSFMSTDVHHKSRVDTKFERVPSVKLFYHADTNTCTYLVVDTETKHAAVIDTCIDYNHFTMGVKYTHADSIIAHINENGLQLDWILETHIHADHLTASQHFKTKFPQAKVAMGKEVIAVQKTWKAFFNLSDDEFTPDGSQFDKLFAEGEKFNIGKLEVSVLYTPGHTPACVCYLVGDAIFTGDTVFMSGLGTARCDFPNGSAKQLFSSAQKILSLPDSTRQFVGHIYGDDASSLRSETTLGEQRANNKHVKAGTSEEDYVSMREKRDAELDPPKLILPSLQVNMRAGHFPKPEANGVSYLKLPLNAFAK